MPDITQHLVPLDDAITSVFIPALLQRLVNEVEREMIYLPYRHGGLGLTAPSSIASQYGSSVSVCYAIIHRILRQEHRLGNAVAQIYQAKSRVRSSARDATRARALAFSVSVGPDLQRSVQLSSEKGS
eukprot:scpid107284/ scgid10490/ 